MNFFDVLGLPRRFAQVDSDVEANYLARSREAHPDFHQLASSTEQRISLDMSAMLNGAYRTLRDPFQRAEYLLTLEGGPSASQAREMAPDFLEEMLELRMEIEALREQGDPARLQAMEKQLRERRGRLIDDVAARFSEYERLPIADSRRVGVLTGVRQLLNTARYVQGLLRDLRAD